ncbi:Mitogen-activated protein kinase kinase kinase kinase 4 [Blastocladiella emersonii ATCC 22665]|nr:Mitogen-activated protein kinase kinase kinase kinase 4 [Blastocladiella emersonii ATCC 22665]
MSSQQQQVNPAKLQAVLNKCPDLRKLGPPDQDVEVLETLGKGNYGYVYRGRIKSRGNTMSAIKVVYLKESELKETWQEVEILKECDHVNVVKLFTTYMQGLYLWIAMEYCGGGSVDTLYSMLPKPMSEEAISVIIHEAVKGLAYFHESKHIHRDIKAGNLLLTEGGEVKLADFGVSARLSGNNTRANSFIGTPFWMAPEVIRSENDRNNWYDAKADVWSIGITVIELADKCPPLAEIHPFTALKLILQDAQPLGLKNPKKRSKPMNEFIALCLTRDPKRRPSCNELLNHPFMQKAETLRGRELIADLVEKSKILRQKKRAGQRIEDNDNDDDAAKYALQQQPAAGAAGGQQYGASPAVAAAVSPAPTASSAGSGAYADAVQAQVSDVQVAAVNVADEDQNVKGKPIIEAKQSYILDEEVLCSDFIGPYLLLGTEKGLLVADLTPDANGNAAAGGAAGAGGAGNSNFVFAIRGVRFKQLAVLEDYGVMVARCGKNDHVRQYRLGSMRKLITAVLAGKRVEMPEPAGIFDRSRHQGIDGSNNPLEDFIKIPSTKDSTNFVVERTAGSIFMLVVVKNDVTLFEWAKDPYLRFMKVKAFWLPEAPRFVSIFHDGYFVRDLLVNYTAEANLVNVEDAKVTELGVATEFRSHGGPDGAPAASSERWRTFDQLPIEANTFQTMRMTVLRQTSVNRKIAAAVSPYQDGMSAVPAAKRRYLATFGHVTHIVDGKAAAQPNTPAFRWTTYPSKLLVVPGLYVIGICEHSVEICDLNTGEKLQVIQHSAQLRFLCDKNGRLVIATAKKRRLFQVFILGATPVLMQQLHHRQQQQHQYPQQQQAQHQQSQHYPPPLPAPVAGGEQAEIAPPPRRQSAVSPTPR